MPEADFEERLRRLEDRIGGTTVTTRAVDLATREFLRTRDVQAAHRVLDEVDRAISVSDEEIGPTVTITVTVTVTVTVAAQEQALPQSEPS
jgi:hypothetical protein